MKKTGRCKKYIFYTLNEKVENELIEAVKNIEDYNFDIKPKVVKFNTTEKENQN